MISFWAFTPVCGLVQRHRVEPILPWVLARTFRETDVIIEIHG
jgi:hypothetical protein